MLTSSARLYSLCPGEYCTSLHASSFDIMASTQYSSVWHLFIHLGIDWFSSGRLISPKPKCCPIHRNSQETLHWHGIYADLKLTVSRHCIYQWKKVQIP
jgi:hypothetical protein